MDVGKARQAKASYGRNCPIEERPMKRDLTKPCQLYRHFDKDGVLLYVGISLSSLIRMFQHEQNAGWFHLVAMVKIENHPTVIAARAAEKHAVTTEKPIHNVRLQPRGPKVRSEKTIAANRKSNREAARRRRRLAGAKPRSESYSQTKPWVELGISRMTWYRRGKPVPHCGNVGSRADCQSATRICVNAR